MRPLLDFPLNSATITTMNQILGHARAMALFQAAMASNRLHHAWIFHGPQGVGKFTVAAWLAKLLLCHSPQSNLTGEQSPCESCQSCRLFGQIAPGQNADAQSDQSANQPKADKKIADDDTPLGSAHPDYHVITKELARYSDDASTRNRKLMNIPVEVLRTELLQRVYLAAQLKHRKVFIVDEAQLIGSAGQNALLKTLEEPPADTHIILVTSSEDKLLPTVRSRCQRLAFGPVPQEAIEPWLTQKMPDLSAGDREWVMSFADGSLGRILFAQKYNLFAWYQQVLGRIDQTVNGRVAPDLGTLMASLIDDLAKLWVEKHANASKEAANKMAAGLMFSMIAQHARRAIDYAATQLPADDPGASEAIMQPWLNVVDALTRAERELAANVNMGLVMDHLVAMIARPNMVHVVES